MSKESATVQSTKRDFKKDLKHLYAPSAKEVKEVDVPAMNFIMLDGRGDPNTAQEFKDAVEALFSVAYALKFLLKKEANFEYTVMPLEGLWWADGGRDANRSDWQWTMMIMQPDDVTPERYAEALKQTRQKKSLLALDNMRLERFHEGAAIQVMHTGPFATEEQTLEKIERFLQEHDYGIRGKHHEIYLSDFRKTAPEKMRTVLRQPVQLSRRTLDDVGA